MDLVKTIYHITKTFPNEEIYWLTSQIRRCAISIPSNIAEWSERSTNKDFCNFLKITKWSLAELETQIIIAKNLEYIKTQNNFDICIKSIIELRKMVSWLINKLK